jgi:hypothetical protein
VQNREMDRKAQRRLVEFILALEQAIAEAEAAPIVNPHEVVLMQRDLAWSLFKISRHFGLA